MSFDKYTPRSFKHQVSPGIKDNDGPSFELDKINYDGVLKNPKIARPFQKQMPRGELFKIINQDLPDIFHYEQEVRQLTEFGKETDYYSPFHFERQGANRPPVKPVLLEHDQTKVLAARENLSSTKHAKKLVNWDKQKERDDCMYGFNKTDIKALLKRLNKK